MQTALCFCLLAYSILRTGWGGARRLRKNSNISHCRLYQIKSEESNGDAESSSSPHRNRKATWKSDSGRVYLPHQPRSPWSDSHTEEATQAAVLKIAQRCCGGVVPQHQTGHLKRTDGRIKGSWIEMALSISVSIRVSSTDEAKIRTVLQNGLNPCSNSPHLAYNNMPEMFCENIFVIQSCSLAHGKLITLKVSEWGRKVIWVTLRWFPKRAGQSFSQPDLLSMSLQRMVRKRENIRWTAVLRVKTPW